jgi:hypothetical protein
MRMRTDAVDTDRLCSAGGSGPLCSMGLLCSARLDWGGMRGPAAARDAGDGGGEGSKGRR